jgi:hypothetical protein
MVEVGACGMWWGVWIPTRSHISTPNLTYLNKWITQHNPFEKNILMQCFLSDMFITLLYKRLEERSSFRHTLQEHMQRKERNNRKFVEWVVWERERVLQISLSLSLSLSNGIVGKLLIAFRRRKQTHWNFLSHTYCIKKYDFINMVLTVY